MTQRSAKEIKDDVLHILIAYEKGYKDKMIGDPYMDGCRSTIKNLQEMVNNIKVEK